MKTLKLIVVSSFTLFFLSASCEKQDPEPVFAQGFSCKINGEEWVAKTPASISGPVPLFVDYVESKNELNLTGTKKDNDLKIYEDIYIYVKEIENVGDYRMETVDGVLGKPIICFIDRENIDECASFYHDSISPGTIEICSINKAKREMTGTFEMNLVAYNCNNEMMHITDGKFAFLY